MNPERDGLDAFDPKVIEGGLVPGKDTDAVMPSNPAGMREFHAGFRAALTAAPRRGGGDDPAAIHSYPPAWRAGYATGRRTRGSLWLEVMIEAIIKRRLAAMEKRVRAAERESTQRHATSGQADAAWTAHFKRKGGPALPYRMVIERFVTTNKPAHTTKTPDGRGYHSLWISPDGQMLYSYGQPIAKKVGTLRAVVDPRKFSLTTTRQQGHLLYRLRLHGWMVSEQLLVSEDPHGR